MWPESDETIIIKRFDREVQTMVGIFPNSTALVAKLTSLDAVVSRFIAEYTVQ